LYGPHSRFLIGFFLIATLPLGAFAQGLAQDMFQSSRPASNGQAQGSQILGPVQGDSPLNLPSIGNSQQQRQQRNGRTNDQQDQSIDPRVQQRLQPLKSQPPVERIEFQDFVAQSTGRDLPI